MAPSQSMIGQAAYIWDGNAASVFHLKKPRKITVGEVRLNASGAAVYSGGGWYQLTDVHETEEAAIQARVKELVEASNKMTEAAKELLVSLVPSATTLADITPKAPVGNGSVASAMTYSQSPPVPALN